MLSNKWKNCLQSDDMTKPKDVKPVYDIDGVTFDNFSLSTEVAHAFVEPPINPDIAQQDGRVQQPCKKGRE